MTRKKILSSLSVWKHAFSVTVVTGYVWTVGQTGEKKTPFSNKNGYVRTGP